MHFWIVEIADAFGQLEPDRADHQSGSEQDESAHHQPADHPFQPLNRRQQGKDRAHLVELQVVFLGQIHERRD